MKKTLITLCALTLSAVTAVMGDVSVTFANSLPGATTAPDLTLDFTVDGSGNVTLDASSSSADGAVIVAIDAWDGSVGTVSYAPAFGTTFSIVISDTGDATRLTDWGTVGGLGVQGQNQNKIDRPGTEELYATAVFDGYLAALDVKSMGWTGAGGGEAQGEKARVDASTGVYNYPVDMTADGSWDLSGSNVYVNAGDSLTFGNDHSITNASSGYVLAGFSFDLKAFEGDSTQTTTFTQNPGTGSIITNVFTVFADGTPTTSSGSSGLPTEGLLAGATGSFDWTWEPVDQFDSNVFTGRVGTGWAYNGGDDAYGPLTISTPNIGMNAGDAIIMTVSTNDLVLPAGKFIRLDNLQIRDDNGKSRVFFYDASEGTSTQITGSDPGQNPVVAGDYVYQTLNQIVEDGDKIAFTSLGGSQIRQYGFQFSLAEVTDQTGVPQNLNTIAVDSAILLDWDDDDTGYPLLEYSVYRALSSGVTTNDFLTNVTVSAFADTGLTNGTTYYYAVTSTGTNNVESALSDVVSATPVADSGVITRIQWLDASDGDNVTTNGSGELTLWGDESGNGNDAVQGPGDPVLWPSDSLSGSGLSGMDVRTNRANITAFTSEETDAFLDFSGEAATNSGFTALVAFKADFVTQDNTRNVVMGTQENAGGGANGFGLRYDRGDMTAFMNSGGLNTLIEKDGAGELEVVDGDTIVFAFTYKTANGSMLFWDSKNNSVSAANTAPFGDFTTSDELYLAGSGNGGQYMDGMIGEVQIFSTTLSEAELISRGEALALKWGAIQGSGFDVWAGLWDVDIGATTNDYDLDGADNLLEYALNGNPTNGADRGLLEIMNEGGVFKYLYASNADSALTYTLVDVNNLVFPTPNTNSYTSVDSGPTVGDYTIVTNNYDTTTDPQLFIELEVEQN